LYGGQRCRAGAARPVGALGTRKRERVKNDAKRLLMGILFTTKAKDMGLFFFRTFS
jgi:hypothetical protein